MTDKLHVMVDIETLATANNAAVIQIGACTMDEYEERFLVSVNQEFYEGFDENSAYCVQERTVDWWSKQSEAARESLGLELVSTPADAVRAFNAWLDEVGFELRYDGQGGIWANPPQFDLTILRNIYEQEDIKIPWHYRQERCARTLWREFGELIPNREIENHVRGLVPHRADHDAIKQARGCIELLKELRS